MGSGRPKPEFLMPERSCSLFPLYISCLPVRVLAVTAGGRILRLAEFRVCAVVG